MKELFVDRGITQSRAALIEDGKLEGLYIENVDSASINGNIYKGRIENIVNGLNAVFVNIGTYKNAILQFDNEHVIKSLKKGQEIIVQVIREGVGDKGPRVALEISIPGKYIVLLPGDNYIGVSKKIDDFNLRKKIKAFMNKIHEENYGVIVRTEGCSSNISQEELFKDYTEVKNMWKDVEKKMEYMKAPQILFNSKDFYEFIIREYVKSDLERIYINRKMDLDYLRNKLIKIDKSYGDKIVYDEYNFTMQDTIEKELEKIKDRKIPIPTGGNIIIDRTEAFTCIDVNSGNFTGNANSEATILNVNLEAAKVISKAVKLRNISGVILIDFIDMKHDENKNALIEAFENEFLDDKSRIKVYGFTKLGILETARAKKGMHINEFIYDNNAFGEENIEINPSYCLKLIENKCLKTFKHYKKNNFEVCISEKIFEDMYNILPNFITDMKDTYGVILTIKKCDSTNLFYIENLASKS